MDEFGDAGLLGFSVVIVAGVPPDIHLFGY